METIIFFTTLIVLLFLCGFTVLLLIYKYPKQGKVEIKEEEFGFKIPKVVNHITSQSDKAIATFLYVLVGKLSESHVISLNNYCNGRINKKQSEIKVSTHRKASTDSAKDAALSTSNSGGKPKIDLKKA